MFILSCQWRNIIPVRLFCTQLAERLKSFPACKTLLNYSLFWYYYMQYHDDSVNTSRDLLDKLQLNIQMETSKIFEIFESFSREFQNEQIIAEYHFLKRSQKISLYTKSFRSIVLLSHKTISISSLKNLQKTEKYYFQRFRIFVLTKKFASKPFSKKLHMTKFWFKKFLMFCLAFPINAFNFLTQNFTKKRKIPITKVQSICFSPQHSFKTISQKASFDFSVLPLFPRKPIRLRPSNVCKK